MIKTEKKYWASGWSIRGGFFNSYAFRLFNLGVMYCWSSDKTKQVYKHLYFYNLI